MGTMWSMALVMIGWLDFLLGARFSVQVIVVGVERVR